VLANDITEIIAFIQHQLQTGADSPNVGQCPEEANFYPAQQKPTTLKKQQMEGARPYSMDFVQRQIKVFLSTNMHAFSRVIPTCVVSWLLKFTKILLISQR